MHDFDFVKLVDEKFTHISFSKKIQNNNHTPLEVYKKFPKKNSFLFESALHGGKWSRYSIIGLESSELIKVNTDEIQHQKKSECKKIKTKTPLEWIEEFYEKFKIANLPEDLPFSSGLVGYFGYETISFIEDKISLNKINEIDVPDITLFVCHEVIVFDSLENTIYIVVNEQLNKDNNYDKAKSRIDDIEKIIIGNQELREDTAADSATESTFIQRFKEEDFMKAVDKIKDYIINGDVMQVVLSQRLSKKFDQHPIDFYDALREMNPSPYMYYLDMDSFQIIGSSPEILVKLQDNKITVRPIAGTRKRGSSETEDEANATDLMSDPKELAEHLMLIDLGRNDIGRISEVGSVKLTEKMIVEKYSHVMHIVSNVEGERVANTTPLSVLKATFPAGTVSGAPKIRAMEIINELEPVKRGIYSGAIGYLSWSGNLDTAISIRTAVVKDNMIHVQAGAGIVYDSEPKKEWIETMNKAKALLSAVEKIELNKGN